MPKSKRKLSITEEYEVIKLYQIGKFSTRAIGRVYDYASHAPIIGILKRHNIKQRPPSERNRLYKLNPHVFDKIDNELAAYWLGFAYADGCVHKRTFQVSLKASDEIQLIKLKEFLESESPIKHVKVGSGKTNKKYKQVLLSVTDKHLTDQLRKLGVIVGRGNFAGYIYNIESNMYQHWIRGLFDGDGSFHSYKPGTSFVGGYILLHFIRAVFAEEIGRNPNIKIHKHPTANIWELRYMGRPQSQTIAKWLYKDATIWLDRKRQIVENYPKPQIRTRDKFGRWE